MKQVLFIGEYDKTDMMFYLSKLISMEHSVLLVDVTTNHKYEYCYPKVAAGLQLNQHENFDVLENILDCVELNNRLKEKNYDYVIVDIDNPNALQKWPAADAYYLATSYENPVIQKNMILMESFFQEKPDSELVPIHKIICDYNGSTGEEFINELLDQLPIDWKDSTIFTPDERDIAQKIKNQTSSRVNLKGLSSEFKKALRAIAGNVLELEPTAMKTLWKNAERGK